VSRQINHLLLNANFMSFLQVQGQNFFLSGSGIDDTQTTIGLTSMTFPNGDTITTADIGEIGYATIEPETEFEENISFTGITQNGDGSATLTGVTRGLDFASPYTTVAGLKLPHAGGLIVRMTNSAPFYTEFSVLRNTETATGVKTFTNFPVKSGTLTPSAAGQMATKQYVDDQVAGGTASYDQNLIEGVAGETLAVGNWVYFKESDARWYKTDADTASTASNLKLGAAQSVAASAGDAVNVVIGGLAKDLSGITAGSRYYLSATAGAVTTTPGEVAIFVGWGFTTTQILMGLEDLPDNVVPGVSGEALTVGNFVYLKNSDGKWYKTDSNAAATTVGVQIGVTQVTVGAADATILVRIAGVDQNQSGLTAASNYFLSGTAGGVATTQGTFIKMVGTAVDSQRILLTGVGDIYAADQQGQKVYGASGAGTDAYAVTYNPPILALKSGLKLGFRADVINTGAATFSPDGLTAKSIVRFDGTALQDGDIRANEDVEVMYNTTLDAWTLQTQVSNVTDRVNITTTPVTVASTASETTLLQVSIPANTLGTNNGVIARLNISNFIGNNGARTATIRAKYGGTTLCTASLIGVDATALAGYIEFQLLSSGSTSSQVGFLIGDLKQDGSGTGTLDATHDVATGTATEVSTGALNLTITVQWDSSSASNTITMHSAYIKRLS
jgi:hypothetical protein